MVSSILRAHIQVQLQKEQLEKVSALGKQRFPKLRHGTHKTFRELVGVGHQEAVLLCCYEF